MREQVKERQSTYDFEHTKPYLIWKQSAESCQESALEETPTIDPGLLKKFYDSFLEAFKKCYGSTIGWHSGELVFSSVNAYDWALRITRAVAFFEQQHKMHRMQARRRLALLMLCICLLISLMSVSAVFSISMSWAIGIMVAIIAIWSECTSFNHIFNAGILSTFLKVTAEIQKQHPEFVPHIQLRSHVLELQEERRVYEALQAQLREIPAVKAYLEKYGSLYLVK